MIADIDIWRAALLMIRRYGDAARNESTIRADELATAGDDNGAAIWRRIEDAVEKLDTTTPSGPVH